MPIDVAQAIFLVYLLVVLGVGVVASRYTTHTPADFYIADRTVGRVVLGLTFVATVLSAFTVFGIGAAASQGGLGTFTALAIAAIFYTLVFATVGVTLFQVGREMGVVTPSEYIRERYESSSLGILYLCVTGIFMIGLITGQLLGGAVALDALMGIPFEAALVLMAVFMIVYIHIAGYRGVIWSDTIQSIVLFSVLGGVTAYVMFWMDSTTIAADAADVTEGLFSLLGPVGLWTPVFIMTFALAFVFGVPAYPHTIQRYFSANSAETTRVAGFIFAGIAIPVYLFGAILGVWSLGVIPSPELPDYVIPLMIEQMMHPVVFGIAIAGATAALMSTADSVALTMSSMISRDVYATVIEPEAKPTTQVRITQVLLIAVILVSLGLAWLQPAGIFDLVAFAVVGFGATSAPVFLGAYWRGATTTGAAASLIVGPSVTILFFLDVIPATFQFGMHYGFIGVVISYVVFVVVSYVTPTPSAESIRTHSRQFGTQGD